MHRILLCNGQAKAGRPKRGVLASSPQPRASLFRRYVQPAAPYFSSRSWDGPAALPPCRPAALPRGRNAATDWGRALLLLSPSYLPTQIPTYGRPLLTDNRNAAPQHAAQRYSRPPCRATWAARALVLPTHFPVWGIAKVQKVSANDLPSSKVIGTHCRLLGSGSLVALGLHSTSIRRAYFSRDEFGVKPRTTAAEVPTASTSSVPGMARQLWQALPAGCRLADLSFGVENVLRIGEVGGQFDSS